MTDQRPNKINNLQRQEIRRRRAQGELIPELAKAFNVSTLTIRYHTRDIRPQKRNTILEVRRDEIIEMLAFGKSQSEIARHFGVVPSAINHALKRLERRAA
jgi:DNA-binding CsgD family transcriptional regulator